MKLLQYWLGNQVGTVPAIAAEFRDRNGPRFVLQTPPWRGRERMSGCDRDDGWEPVPIGCEILWPTQDRVYRCEAEGLVEELVTREEWERRSAQTEWSNKGADE